MTIVAAIAGFVGAAVITFGWIYGIVGYNSRDSKPFGRNFSPFTHLVSQLGHESTPHSTAFNICLVVGAVALGVVLAGVALLVHNDDIKWVMVGGAILAGVAGAFVGIFPSGKPTEGSPTHLVFALTFFLLSGATVAVFTAHVLFATGTGFSVGLAIPGIVLVLAALLMLIAGLVNMIRSDTDWSVPDLVDNNPPPDPIPTVMLLPTAEWSYVFLLNVWVLIMSFFLLTRL